VRRREKIQRLLLAVLAVLPAFAFTLGGIDRAWLSGWRSSASDTVFPRGELDERIVVVGIDGKALEQAGRWPWPRETMATIVNNLADAGVRTIAIDVVFDSPLAGDVELAQAMSRVPTVLGWFPQARRYDPELDVFVFPANSVVEPTPVLRDAAAALGHTTISKNPLDGVVRRVPLLMDDGVQFRPSLSLAAFAVATGEVPENAILKPNAVQLGQKVVPTTKGHLLNISFTEGFTDRSAPGFISAADLLGSPTPELIERLRNRVVLIGVADENLGDNEPTPLNNLGGQPGVSVHANALNTMLQDIYVRDAPRWQVLLLVLLSGLAISLVTLFLGIRAGLLSAVLVVVGTFAWLVIRSASTGNLIDIVFPWVGAVLTLGCAVSLRYFVADRQRRRATNLFRQYVPLSVSNQLLERGLLEQQVSGVRVDVSTMFCDLRGFTALTHELGPQVLRTILNHYYEYATEIVERHDGTLMQFVGDEVYAVFGAPLPSADHQQRALACAVDLVADVHKLDATLVGNGMRTIRFGVGVATGSAIAAHVGSSSRRQYSVVGDAVNLGARLCSQAKANQVVASGVVAHGGDLDTVLGAKTAPGSPGSLTLTDEQLMLKGFDDPYPVRRVELADATGVGGIAAATLESSG
jgi:adenylate cyclase